MSSRACNLCLLKGIERRAAKDGQQVRIHNGYVITAPLGMAPETVLAAFTWAPDGIPGSWHPVDGISIEAWMMGIPNECAC